MHAPVPFLLVVASIAVVASAASINLEASDPFEEPADGRNIVGGVETIAPGWMASIRNGKHGESHRCGGSLIHPQWVLTAAHCVHGFKQHTVWLGGTKQSEPSTFSKYHVVKGIVHPKYDEEKIVNDVALLLLDRPATNSRLVGMNRIRGAHEKSGTTLTAMGWGQLSYEDHTPVDTIRKVDVPVVSNKLCAFYMGPTVAGPGVVCAGPHEGGKDACSGDSGGPLFTGNTVVGIVSWGNDCGQPWQYGVYTRVSYYVDWVDGVISKNTP